MTHVQSNQPHRTASPKRGSRVFSHFSPTLTCLGTDSQTTGAAKQGQEVATMTWVSSKTQNMDLTEIRPCKIWVTFFNNGGVCGLRVQYFTKIKVKNIWVGCWWGIFEVLVERGSYPPAETSQNIPSWKPENHWLKCAGWEGTCWFPASTSQSRWIVVGCWWRCLNECLLFDSPKMGNLMTPGQMGVIFRFHAFGGLPICTSPQSRSIFVKFLGGSIRFLAVLGGHVFLLMALLFGLRNANG